MVQYHGADALGIVESKLGLLGRPQDRGHQEGNFERLVKIGDDARVTCALLQIAVPTPTDQYDRKSEARAVDRFEKIESGLTMQMMVENQTLPFERPIGAQEFTGRTETPDIAAIAFE